MILGFKAKKLKGKITAIVLFCSLALPIVTTYFIVQHKKSILKKEIKHQLISGVDKNDLILLKFSILESQTKLKWKHDKEFEFKKEMYDIVEVETKKDSIYYWCWWDHKETKLEKRLKSILAFMLDNNPDNKKNQQRFLNFYKSLFHQTHKERNYTKKSIIKNNFSYVTNYSSLSLSPPTPPPNIIL